MSVVTSRSSILKNYVPANRNKIRQSITNRVQFDLLSDKKLQDVLEDAATGEDLKPYENYLRMIREPSISDKDFLRAIEESRQCIGLLKSHFSIFVEALVSMKWTTKGPDIVLEYQKFLLDLLSAHSLYMKMTIDELISYWLPNADDEHLWKHGLPTGIAMDSLQYVHEVIAAILDVIPISQKILMEEIENLYPYFNRPAYVVSGFVHNLFWLLDYRPIFKEDLLYLLLKKLITLDVNAPRSEIENAEYEEEEDKYESIFCMDDVGGDVKNYEEDEMRNSKAETLDICMEKLLAFIQKEYQQSLVDNRLTTMVNMFLKYFDNIILPTHSTHHIQFVLFYLCSFKLSITEMFLKHCWQKVCDPNIAPAIRQAAINYMISMMARAKYVPLGLIKDKLQDMCNWVHQYIQRCDSGQNIYLLRAHLVFYAMCQGIFYIVSFRSRDLTGCNKNILFLNSLQLTTIVSSHLNPLRVCRPEIATAFAGVTRAYQIAYCHSILERNARCKLAVVFSNDIAKPEDCLDTYFPFDPYILKKSGKRIQPLYLQYQASEAEEGEHDDADDNRNRRKRINSVTNGDDVDDFIVDKKQKITELSMSFDRELQFNHL